MANCPVCGRAVDEAAAKAQAGTTPGGAPVVDPAAGTRQFHDGTWVYFDSLECRGKFLAQPEHYIGPERSD